MNLTSEFQNAVRSWEQTPRPFENFRTSRGSALTYGIECDLDHQASYLETMIRQWQEKNPHWDFRMRAQNELRDLGEYKERIAALELADDESGPLLRYVFATRLLLETIAEMAAREPRE